MNIHEQYFHQTDISVMIKDIERRDNNNGAYCLLEIAALLAMILFLQTKLMAKLQCLYKYEYKRMNVIFVIIEPEDLFDKNWYRKRYFIYLSFNLPMALT